MAKAYPTILREGGGTLKKAARLFSTCMCHTYISYCIEMKRHWQLYCVHQDTTIVFIRGYIY